MILPSINYEHYGKARINLYERWEYNSNFCDTITPSVVFPNYRNLIVSLALKGKAVGSTLISIGSGNGFTEFELLKAGFTVLATDINGSALAFAKKKGIDTIRLNVLEDQPRLRNQFDIVYADGLLGHLWTPESGFIDFFQAASRLTKPNGVILISNDLAEYGQEFNCKVTADRHARFFRGSRELTLKLVFRFPNLELIEEVLFPYFRTGKRLRIRQILLLKIKFLI